MSSATPTSSTTAGPFTDVDATNSAVINMWNDMVALADEVRHLGDVGMGSCDETLRAVTLPTRTQDPGGPQSGLVLVGALPQGVLPALAGHVQSGRVMLLHGGQRRCQR